MTGSDQSEFIWSVVRALALILVIPGVVVSFSCRDFSDHKHVIMYLFSIIIAL